MTERFDKFMEWSYLDDSCRRRIDKDASEHIKEEAKKLTKNTTKELADMCCTLIIKWCKKLKRKIIY